MKEPGSLIRIKKFSDSENENDEEIMLEQESNQEDDNNEISENLTANKLKPSSLSSKELQKSKKRKKGIIFISNIPKNMNVAICRELMEKFGEVGRIFLQPDKKGMTKKANNKKKNVVFTEGWVEFEKKRIAKWVAGNINTTPISNKKGSPFCDILWNLKYLPGFKWIHLSERLTYERAVYTQKLNIATSQARKEANFFQNNLDKSEKFKKRMKGKLNKKI
ncbi:CLUMA_CG004971, isoform A [Clunio marinus]|uniref:Activator of basal transcription 1 n=1 Tax=Clunio marinus TaxID=568069 RepID=A0A1J1HTG8_9DIPT|nr:CLUMA_CG004971, isoform A [Clunio marinus]